jgi:hydrogenase maturation factor HypF (carbamoyltransferase family)
MGEEKEIISSCPSCGSRYKVPPGFRGKTLCCKKCGTPFKLTESSENQTKEPKAETAADKNAQLIELDDSCLVLGRLVVKYCYANEEQVREAIAFQAKESSREEKSLWGRFSLPKEWFRRISSIALFPCSSL